MRLNHRIVHAVVRLGPFDVAAYWIYSLDTSNDPIEEPVQKLHGDGVVEDEIC